MAGGRRGQAQQHNGLVDHRGKRRQVNVLNLGPCLVKSAQKQPVVEKKRKGKSQLLSKMSWSKCGPKWRSCLKLEVALSNKPITWPLPLFKRCVLWTKCICQNHSTRILFISAFYSCESYKTLVLWFKWSFIDRPFSRVLAIQLFTRARSMQLKI